MECRHTALLKDVSGTLANEERLLGLYQDREENDTTDETMVVDAVSLQLGCIYSRADY